MYAIWDRADQVYLRTLGDYEHNHIWDNRPDVARQFNSVPEAEDVLREWFYHAMDICIVELFIPEIDAPV